MTLNISKIKNSLSVIIQSRREGQRLRSLTRKIPKPVIKIKNKSMTEPIINHFLNTKLKKLQLQQVIKIKKLRNSL